MLVSGSVSQILVNIPWKWMVGRLLSFWEGPIFRGYVSFREGTSYELFRFFCVCFQFRIRKQDQHLQSPNHFSNIYASNKTPLNPCSTPKNLWIFVRCFYIFSTIFPCSKCKAPLRTFSACRLYWRVSFHYVREPQCWEASKHRC